MRARASGNHITQCRGTHERSGTVTTHVHKKDKTLEKRGKIKRMDQAQRNHQIPPWYSFMERKNPEVGRGTRGAVPHTIQKEKMAKQNGKWSGGAQGPGTASRKKRTIKSRRKEPGEHLDGAQNKQTKQQETRPTRADKTKNEGKGLQQKGERT